MYAKFTNRNCIHDIQGRLLCKNNIERFGCCQKSSSDNTCYQKNACYQLNEKPWTKYCVKNKWFDNKQYDPNTEKCIYLYESINATPMDSNGEYNIAQLYFRIYSIKNKGYNIDDAFKFLVTQNPKFQSDDKFRGALHRQFERVYGSWPPDKIVGFGSYYR